jgi:peptidyl-prolyl cis-trans isomerase D
MLEAMRRNSRSVIIYVLFGVIIAVFIINFGPGSRGCSTGGSVASFAVKVAGSTVSEQDFRFTYLALGGSQIPAHVARERRIKEIVMDKLIERELFAEEAERLGFEVSHKEAEDMIADGRMLAMGVPRRVDGYVFGKDGKFDYERFKAVAQNSLGVTVARFIDIQRRELLANKLRELVKQGTKVSLDEVKADFEQKGLQVNLEYARFSTRRYEDDGEISQAEIDAFVKGHADELKKQYDERAFLYKKVDRQARTRHILVEVEKDAAPDAVAAAKKKADDAAAKLKAGAAFGEVAKSYSSDERTKRRGGVVGWRKKGYGGYGDALETKILAAKKGELVGPEKTDRGFEIVLVEDFREGDVPIADAERELAEEQVHGERAKAKAKLEAEAILDKVKKGEKLDVLIPKETPEESARDKAEKPLAHRLVEAPKLQETGLFARHGEMVQDIGVSKELAKRAFELKVGEVAGPFEASGGWVVVRVKEHKDPDIAEFEKRKTELMRDFERNRWEQVVNDWSKQHCVEVRDEGRIKVNDEVLTYEGAPPGKDRPKYEPCSPQKLF